MIRFSGTFRLVAFLLVVTMVSISCRLEIDQGTPIPATETASPTITEREPLHLPIPPTPVPVRVSVTAKRSLYVRSWGYFGSNIVGVLYYGEVVTIKSKCSRNGWVKIEKEKISGWVNSYYLDGGCNE